MLIRSKVILPMMVRTRTFKNFGHKRQPIPLVTTLWHGFLTFSFTGMCLNWTKIQTWMFGEDTTKVDWDE